jgi:hypothetical protein
VAALIVVFSAILLRLRRRYLESDLWFGPALFATVSTTAVVNLFAQLLNSSGFLFGPNRTRDGDQHAREYHLACVDVFSRSSLVPQT